MKTKKRAISVVLTLAVVFAVSALTAMQVQVQDVKNGPDFADPSMNYAMGEEVKLLS